MASLHLEGDSAQITPPHIAQALSGAATSSEAIHNLYRCLKGLNPNFSIPYLCKKAGISSQGYLSDVMHSKRVLNQKYRAGIIRAFGLKGPAARYLKALIDIDHEKDAERAKTLSNRLPTMKKAMSIVHRSIGPDMAEFFLALEVFCAFGLFKNRPTLQGLARYFASRSSAEVHRAILLLEELRLVEREGEHYTVSTGQVNFGGDHFSQVDYLKLAFKHGIQSIDKWYQQPGCSLFESINISVKKAELAKYLPIVQQNTEDIRLGLETEDGDMVVRMNIQIYPVE